MTTALAILALIGWSLVIYVMALMLAIRPPAGALSIRPKEKTAGRMLMPPTGQ